MRLSRIYLQASIEPEQALSLHGASAHYVQNVLRLAVGDSLILFNGDGCDYCCTIARVAKRNLLLDVETRLPAAPESALKITLLQAISRGDKMDTCLQKATELGVHCIQPLWSKRVTVKLQASRELKRVGHWQKVVISACEQSGRALVPQVNNPVTLVDWLLSGRNETAVLLSPGTENTLAEAFSGSQMENRSLALLVGPEGGFSNLEIEQMLLDCRDQYLVPPFARRSASFDCRSSRESKALAFVSC